MTHRRSASYGGQAPADLAAARRAILAAALPAVPFDGWSAKALRLAAVAAGYDEAMARRAFPRGPGGLVDFFFAETDRRMAETLAHEDIGALRIRERIALAVRTELELMTPWREAVRRAIALRLQPGHAARALRGLYRTVDAMWWAAGDNATDFNHYTKRALLAGVYASTLVFWLNDQSEDCADTWAFLDRRIGEVMRIQKLTGRLRSRGARLPTPWRLLATLRYGPQSRVGS